MTLSVGDPDALVAAGKARVADGFDVLKVKVGTGDAAADFERVRRVREAIGPEPRLRLDANQGWTRRDAVTAIRAMEDAGCAIELVEQPVAAADLEGMAWITDRVSTPILADESVYGVRDLVAVIRHGAADLVNVKLAKCGGLGAGPDAARTGPRARPRLDRRLDDGEPRRRRRGRRAGRGVPDDRGQRPRRGLVAEASRR